MLIRIIDESGQRLSGTHSVNLYLSPQAETEGAAATKGPEIVSEDDLSPYAMPGDAPEQVEIDPDYASRLGYDPRFLGPDLHFPTVTNRAIGDPAPLRRGRGHELKYHHFSAIMNAQRRFAFVTGVNIDGSLARELDRDGDRWLFDPRMSEEYQVGEELYKKNDLDRGHLVRRLDPCWGKSSRLRLFAASDTFHFTNCSPQHARFNQSQHTWAGLENYILSNAVAERAQISVFTGPVFSASDPKYRGILLPKQFWKVVAYLADERLCAAAYLLTQRNLLTDLESAISFGPYRTFQVAVRRVEQLTGIEFDPHVREGDVFVWQGDEAVSITQFSDIQLRP